MSQSDLAPSPFSAASSVGVVPADLILRSSDGVDFYVHKYVIVKASTDAFKDASCPVTHPSKDVNGFLQTVPIVCVKDPRDVVYRLLLLSYEAPIEGYPVDMLQGVHVIYRVAYGYNMFGICAKLRAIMHARMAAEPLRVFAIACNLALAQTVKFASLETLKDPDQLCSGEYDAEEYAWVTGSKVLSLIRFRVRCSEVAGTAVDKQRKGITELESDEALAAGGLCWWSATGHARGCGGWMEGSKTKVWNPAPWFQDHMARFHKAVVDLPGGETAAEAVTNIDKTLLHLARCGRCASEGPKQLRGLAARLKNDIDSQIEVTANGWPF
ncbi:hypothetical protein FB45DRAFT_917527 [Roridomyces roridus]|uniref:BTB domain-containing protein n=1 Tax=Roridomyces roridus TaxID=1738132 RepID=A0AAD7BUP8_9AGAR|nr:hypothetical protein FB45DRAFT_917527 [Roridomyces roridus]